jgi:hypothetical protein
MIKLIKLGDNIIANIEPYYYDEEGNQIWNIPNTLDELKNAMIDTYNWLIGQSIKNLLGDDTKLPASNSKAIALLVKIISQVIPENTTLNLTDLEKSAWNKLLFLVNNGYSDSELLNASLDAVINNINEYSKKIEDVLKINDFNELLNYIQGITTTTEETTSEETTTNTTESTKS